MLEDKILEEINNKIKQENLRVMNIQELNIIKYDITRVLDKKVNLKITKIKKTKNITINYEQKVKFRRAILGYIDHRIKVNVDKIDEIKSNRYINKIYCKDKENILNSIIVRYKMYFLGKKKHITEQYLEYLKEMQKNKYQLIYLQVRAKDHLSSDDINKYIKNNYDKLSNYHNMAITFQDSINEHIDFNIISKVAIYMENFLQENKYKIYNKYNKDKRIQELKTYLKQQEDIKYTDKLSKQVETYYKGVSYGFRFVDLYISNDATKKTLIMQKVKLDETSIRCPECYKNKTRGNSYDKILLKSFECLNPQCPLRSKSGRGKRYSLYSAKCQIMLKKNSKQDQIDDNIYQDFRRDIVNKSSLKLNNIVKLYTWADDKVLASNIKGVEEKQGRRIIYSKLKHQINTDKLYKNLRIYKILQEICNSVNIKESKVNIKKVNRDESTILIPDDSKKIGSYKKQLGIKISSVITSPPYYNAREYSQWSNLLIYLIDMMINAKGVYVSLEKGSKYVYNIGDIVGKDNIYIRSNMSKRRIILGFYSILIFNLVGYTLINNIIWDKGEVQSKRNSTMNHNPGYLKPINVYEHNLIFIKELKNKEVLPNKVIRVDPVRKINAKGVNIKGHTAPYPKEIAELVLPYTKEQGYILDPFLGSGTTCIMAKEHGKQSIGFEIKNKYYQLAVQNKK